MGEPAPAEASINRSGKANALPQVFNYSPWTIHHKALIIFQKSKNHHRKIVNYRITEKGDLKMLILILCNLTISSHCTAKQSFCVHNPLLREFPLNHSEMSIVQSASICYFITEYLISLTCFTDVLKKYSVKNF